MFLNKYFSFFTSKFERYIYFLCILIKNSGNPAFKMIPNFKFLFFFFFYYIPRGGRYCTTAILQLLQTTAYYCKLLQTTANYCTLLQTTANNCKLLHTTANYCKLLQTTANYCIQYCIWYCLQ